jgi:hypothetical protein
LLVGGFCCLSLYVGVAVLNSPKDCLRSKLDFATATFSNACYGVRYLFFSTRPAWFHAEAATVWMWKNVEEPKN